MTSIRTDPPAPGTPAPAAPRGLQLRVIDPADADPLPRPAAVSPASAYSAVGHAQTVIASRLSVESAEPTATRRLSPLRTWGFAASPQSAGRRTVVVPDTWSRRDPALAEHRGPCRYEREITATGPFARLLLDAADYAAIVTIDGEVQAVHEGGFTPIGVDLPVGRPVTVTVDVFDPVEPNLLGPNPALAPKRKIKGVLEWHDSRPGGLATSGLFDRRWVRRWGTGGMTGPASLHQTGPVRIDAVFATPVRPGQSWQLKLSWIVTNLADHPQDAVLSAALDGQAIIAEVRLAPGANRCAILLEAEGAQPWEPDSPYCYTLQAAVSVDEATSDAMSVPVGFRVTTMRVEGDEQFHLTVNGRRTYMRGVNYIGGLWLPELTAELVRKDVALAKAAHVNVLGVHASTCPQLYDVADREGMLLQQDFPMQWSYEADGGPVVEGGPSFRQAALELAAELVYDLYNHPSVIYWCAHNEPAYQLADAFAAREALDVTLPLEFSAVAELIRQYPDESGLDNERTVLFRRLDPSRTSHVASGLGGHRPDGDTHDYAGSLAGGYASDGKFGRTAFVSEYGVWSANFCAASRSAAAAGDWPPPPQADADWLEQTHHVSIQSAYAGSPQRYDDFATWCFAGQLWGGWHAKICAEQSRAARFSPTGGHRWHFLVDHWGDAGAGVVDRLRTTGPAYRGLAAANRPFLPIISPPYGCRVEPGTTVRLPITVVNDTANHFAGSVAWRMTNLTPEDCFVIGADVPDHDVTAHASTAPAEHVCVLPRRTGTILAQGSVEATVAADSAVTVTEIEWTANTNGPVAVFVEAGGVENWAAFLVEPKDWRARPGLATVPRFRVTSDRPGTLRRRWTGAPVDPTSLSPDQYLLDDLPVDVYDDTHIAADGHLTTASLPWPIPG